ncbi:MAG: hypothetical protein ACHRXM_40205, partial [Isosphaerales bacterium]
IGKDAADAMALRDEIEAVRDRALAGLNDAHDYFTYTKGAWRMLQFAVQRDGLKFSLRNPSTNSTVNEEALLGHAQRYVAEDLASATLQQFVSIFENFLSDALRLWLLAFPKSFAKRQLSGKEIFGLPDKAAIVDALVEKELKDVFYDRPANWFEYLKDHVDTGAPAAAEAEQFAEVKATRDVLVHGQGVANAYYVDKAGKAARAQSGQPLDVAEPYHQASWELICKLVRDIGTGMAAKA